MNLSANKDPQVTVCVIMPAYNAELYIEKAIRSVMNQTFTQWELLVIEHQDITMVYMVV